MLEFCPHFTKERTAIYGLNLKQLDKKYEIIDFVKPADIMPNPIIDIFTRMFKDSSLPEYIAKNKANVFIGKLGKKIEDSIIVNGTFYKTEEECDFTSVGGRIQAVLDKDGNIFGYWLYTPMPYELSNGFKPIHQLVADCGRMKLYNLSKDI